MNEFKKPRYITQRVQFGAGVQGIQKVEVTLDNQYSHCDGVAVFYTGATNTPADFNIGLADAEGTIQDRTIAKEWTSGQDVPHKLRYKDVYIEANGRKAILFFEAIPSTGFSAAVDLQVVFRCVAKN